MSIAPAIPFLSRCYEFIRQAVYRIFRDYVVDRPKQTPYYLRSPVSMVAGYKNGWTNKMSSLKKVLDKWQNGSKQQQQKAEKAAKWLASNCGCYKTFKKNIQADCVLPVDFKQPSACSAHQLGGRLAKINDESCGKPKEHDNPHATLFNEWAWKNQLKGSTFSRNQGEYLYHVTTLSRIEEYIKCANSTQELEATDVLNGTSLLNALKKKLPVYPQKKNRIVWATWPDNELPCHPVTKAFESPLGTESFDDNIISSLKLRRSVYKDNQQYKMPMVVFRYKLPESERTHIPTIADAGYNNAAFKPKPKSKPYGRTRSSTPCHETVHAPLDINHVESIIFVSRPPTEPT